MVREDEHAPSSLRLSDQILDGQLDPNFEFPS